jgi:hypothetical protein
MTDIAPSQPAAPLPADSEAELDRYLAEIRDLNKLMRRDQAIIDRLKAETAALKAESASLRDETQALMAETWDMINKLQAAA